MNKVVLKTMEFQATKMDGTHDGNKTFGFILYDDNASAYVDAFDSLEERNNALKIENIPDTFSTYIDCDILQYLLNTIEDKGGFQLNDQYVNYAEIDLE